MSRAHLPAGDFGSIAIMVQTLARDLLYTYFLVILCLAQFMHIAY